MSSIDSNQDLTRIRREYLAESFDEQDLQEQPHQQFHRWFEQHRQLDPANATAMVLATASEQGLPSARIVLLKHFDQGGYCWYTDYRSLKGQQLAANPQAELLFYWPELDRQVRISGQVEKLERASAEQYFSERPRGSQLSAAISHQSHPVADRQQLERQVESLERKLDGDAVCCPQQWGGYRLVPQRYEFWQGRENRLHDRLVYSLDQDIEGQERDAWRIQRLAP
ncbi:pyridoxamine 5'-phosphate oxidase [Motiliproteus coralliicola]|uniref:Pyridoxine/pyridoxamine 5'-phosphate oxidase n=1 Tax=Motiliproteus coralliicola TaxID=2283196 RepID=A0A369WX84_9GAMM|nr:pyridoxamine 5'-phosphate oxidase [Motiliproteus coralliicola]RDE24125.1 pyridoxamine 5'-phosphate oxidase [Motiliproteus coralliicola]